MTSADAPTPAVEIANSVTKLDARHRGCVLIGGSHGGVYAGYMAAKAGVRGVILSDAGVGLDQAGIGALSYLDGLGLAAATVGHGSCRIGDGADMAARGRISHCNAAAAAVGVRVDMAARAAADAMRAARPPEGEPPVYEESRFLLDDPGAGPKVWGIDSTSLVRPEDEADIVVAGSHGGLMGGAGGDPAGAIRYDVVACAFNDAGIGIDEAGISRLPVLDGRSIPAVTVDHMTARIGDARSHWDTGRISRTNQLAAAAGVRVGMDLPAFAAAIRDNRS